MEKHPRELMEDLEEEYLSSYATKSSDPDLTRREFDHGYVKDDFRTEFERDFTRIIHSRPFRRLRHKTQVFMNPRNDHLCSRLEHSLHVLSVARTISNALRLNSKLVEAMAVGHDLGHAPFGHRGENCLREIEEIKNARLDFCHEFQGLRIVDFLESPYQSHLGLNLTFAVRDGIACHWGEEFEQRIEPDRSKKPEDLRQICPATHGQTASAEKRKEIRPATLEGCVVRWADKVAYLGRDLDDAVALKIVAEDDIPPKVVRVLGPNNRKIIAALVKDIVEHSEGHDYIEVGDEIYQAIQCLKDFNDESIYKSNYAVKAVRQIEVAIPETFKLLLAQLGDVTQKNVKKLQNDNLFCLQVFGEFLDKDANLFDLGRKHKWCPEQMVLDFIAGMTDSFFIRTFSELFLPESPV